MTVADDIREAERRHLPHLHLFRAAVESKRQELEFENSMAHEVSTHTQNLTTAITSLVKIAESGPMGRAMVEQELAAMERPIGLLCSLMISALMPNGRE